MAERASLPEEAAEEHEQVLRDSRQAQYDENTPEGAAPPADEMEDVRESSSLNQQLNLGWRSLCRTHKTVVTK